MVKQAAVAASANSSVSDRTKAIVALSPRLGELVHTVVAW